MKIHCPTTYTQNKYMSEKEQVIQTPTSDCSIRCSTWQSSEHYLTTLLTFKKFKKFANHQMQIQIYISEVAVQMQKLLM